MYWEDLLRRAGGVEARVGRGSSRWCFGRFICLNCPRDYHVPPFLPFALPIHIREHLQRFPGHCIRFWCWDHCQLEARGDGRMTQQAPPETAIFAVCSHHYQFWILSEERPNCLVCGGPPTHALALPVYGEASAPAVEAPSGAEAPPEEPITITVKCPHCDGDVTLAVTEESIAVVSPPIPTPKEEVAGGAGGATPATSPSTVEEPSRPPSTQESVEGINVEVTEGSPSTPPEVA